MAVYVHKTWNPGADVIPDGVSVELGGNGLYLCVLNAEGQEIAKFKSQVVRDYWIETNPTSSLAGVNRLT